MVGNYAKTYSYDLWLQQDALSERDRQAIRLHIKNMRSPPTISIALPVHDVSPALLDKAIRSVLGQLYPHWELCIADDASAQSDLRDLIVAHACKDNRIRYVLRDTNGHISAASNSAVALTSGEFITFLDHDDELSELALYMVASCLENKPNLDMIYSDEDKLSVDGRRYDPYFKPDWNPDLLLGQNYICHLAVYRTSLLHKLGGFRIGLEGAQDWDLALRVSEQISEHRIAHIPFVLYHWRAAATSTASNKNAKPYAITAGQRAVIDHLARVGRNGEVLENDHAHFRVRLELEQPAPKVSIIVPTRNACALVRQCINSVTRRTRYGNYEIIVVDNQSDELETLNYLREIEANGIARIIRDDRPFNYSGLNNRAVLAADGDVLCLLNNDIQVISDNWLEEMVTLAIRPGSGAVGAMLYYPDDTIQHAGTALGLGGVAGHLYWAADANTAGQMGRARLTQNLSAVTGACLVVRKSVFDEVGGLNESDLAVAFNDVDFCLRLLERGYRNVWTPFAKLYHHESATRGADDTSEKLERFGKEIEYMRQRWGDLLEHDPAYNPNLSLDISWPTPSASPRTRKPWRQKQATTLQQDAVLDGAATHYERQL